MANRLDRIQKTANWIPISDVVDMAHIDDYDDAQVMRQRFTNWAVRGYKKLRLNLLREIRSLRIPINRNTGTAPLPGNYQKWMQVAVYDYCGHLIDIPMVNHVEIIPDTSKCACKICTDHTMCDMASYERTEEEVVMNDVTYTKTTVLFYDKSKGVYKRETKEPVMVHGDTPAVEMQTRLEELCTLETLPCGCIKKTEENAAHLCGCGCYTAQQYFAVTTNQHRMCSDDFFTIDEEAGLIHVHAPGADHVYLKYRCDLPCINGMVYVPEVCGETLAAWILYKKDLRRKSVPGTQKKLNYDNYRAERKEMRKAILPIRISIIENSVMIIPNL